MDKTFINGWSSYKIFYACPIIINCITLLVPNFIRQLSTIIITLTRMRLAKCGTICDWYPTHCYRKLLKALDTIGKSSSISLLTCWCVSQLYSYNIKQTYESLSSIGRRSCERWKKQRHCRTSCGISDA